jgi:ATP-dependent Clp protease ATP-binding subunit ClpC
VILIMTSNLGSQQMKSGTKLGFDRFSDSIKPSDEERRTRMQADVMIEVERYFRPEFLNRIDELIVFNSLTHADLARIVHLQLNDVRKRLTEKGVTLEFDQPAIDFLITKGYSEDYGARPLRRAIERYVEDPLAEELLRREGAAGEPIQVRVSEDGQSLSFAQPKPSEAVHTP